MSSTMQLVCPAGSPPAFRAAIDGNYSIETDLQISADGEAMFATGELSPAPLFYLHP